MPPMRLGGHGSGEVMAEDKFTRMHREAAERMDRNRSEFYKRLEAAYEAGERRSRRTANAMGALGLAAIVLAAVTYLAGCGACP